jgi:hypothetical protein
VALVAELHENHENFVRLLAGKLDVLVDLAALGLLVGLGGGLLAHLHDGAVAALLGLLVTGEHVGECFLAQGPALLLSRAGQVVNGRSDGFRRVARWWCRLSGRSHCRQPGRHHGDTSEADENSSLQRVLQDRSNCVDHPME